jgi:uncharacterized protein (TIRG00374 family)
MARGRYYNPRRRRLRKGIRWGVGVFVVLLLVEYLVLPELGREGASQSLNLIGRVNVAYLLAGVVLEAAALVAYAQLTNTVLPKGGPSRPRLLQINMSSLALSHVLPGGTGPGAALSYRLLTQNSVSGPDAGFAIAMQGVGSAVVLNVIFWIALFVSLFIHGYNPLYTLAASAGVVMMGAFAGVIVMLTRGRKWSVEVVRRLAERVPFLDADKLADAVQQIAFRLRVFAADREVLYRAVRWAAANWLLDAASLWVFIAAFHKLVSPIDLLVAYGLANVLAVIPITPGGLGLVEGVLVTTLHGFHVPSRVALVGVLGYRLVNFWLPIPVGGGAYLSLRFTSQGWRQRISSAHDQIVEQGSGDLGESHAPTRLDLPSESNGSSDGTGPPQGKQSADRSTWLEGTGLVVTRPDDGHTGEPSHEPQVGGIHGSSRMISSLLNRLGKGPGHGHESA